MSTLIELLKTRRSIRKYLPQAIEPENQTDCFSSFNVPASKRSNPWEFIVVQDAAIFTELADSRPHGSQLLLLMLH